MGKSYQDGCGTEVNHRKAIKFFLKASRQGHNEATLHLAKCFEEGTLTEGRRELGRALGLYKEAARRKHQPSLQRYGELLQRELVAAPPVYGTRSLMNVCCVAVEESFFIPKEITAIKPSRKDPRHNVIEGKMVKDEVILERLMALPQEVRERLSTKWRRQCDKLSCTQTFYGEGKVQRYYFEKGLATTEKGKAVLVLSFCSISCCNTVLS